MARPPSVRSSKTGSRSLARACSHAARSFDPSWDRPGGLIMLGKKQGLKVWLASSERPAWARRCGESERAQERISLATATLLLLLLLPSFLQSPLSSQQDG